MMNKKCLGLLLLFILITSCVRVGVGIKDRKDTALHLIKNRLSDAIVPVRYDLTLWTDATSEDFKGQVIIDLSLKEAKNSVTLHASDLSLGTAIIEQHKKTSEGKTRVLENGFIAIDFPEPIAAGQAQLIITFNGTYNKNLQGLYKVRENNEHYLFTQFEPIAARKMFPCFDEPRFKTPVKMTVHAPKGQTVIANSPLLSQESKGDWIVNTFAETEPLPTYLLALMVGPFDVVEAPNLSSSLGAKKHIPLRGIATKGKGAKLAFALRKTPQIVKKLEKYFGIAYPFHKLDIIAVPDFNAGAMENAGAITFREWLLLVDDNTASVAQQQSFYEVMAHELAHQWFGNSVTMAWWDDLWLNEAFATWLSFKIVDEIKPEYKLKEKLTSRAYDAMDQDGMSVVRTIREPILSSHDIHNAFDGITYLKGGAVLSMWESFIGPKRFKKAVSHHVKRFPYGSATSKDFLESLAAYSSPELIKSADSFLNQKGFPVVDLSYTCEKAGFKVHVSQNRYVPMGSKAKNDAHWEIPLCFGYEKKGSLKKHCVMMSKKSESIKIKSAHCPEYIMPNFNGQGYYRFALSEAHWQKLLDAPYKKLSRTDRLSLADSLVSELYQGKKDFSFVTKGLRSMINKNDLHVVRIFMGLIMEAHKYWVSEPQQKALMTYARDALWPIYDELQKSAQLSSNDKLLRRDLAHFLAHSARDEAVRADMTRLGKSYFDDLLRKDHPQTRDEMMSSALGVVLQDQDEATLKKVMQKLKSQRDAVVRSNVLGALSFARTGEKATTIRELVFDKDLRQNEQMPLLMNHLREPGNQPATWSFVKTNIDALKKGLVFSQLGALPYLARGLCSEDSASEVDAFFSPFIKDYEGGPRNLAETNERIAICAARQHFCAPHLTAFFKTPKEPTVVSVDSRD